MKRAEDVSDMIARYVGLGLGVAMLFGSASLLLQGVKEIGEIETAIERVQVMLCMTGLAVLAAGVGAGFIRAFYKDE